MAVLVPSLCAYAKQELHGTTFRLSLGATGRQEVAQVDRAAFRCRLRVASHGVYSSISCATVFRTSCRRRRGLSQTSASVPSIRIFTSAEADEASLYGLCRRGAQSKEVGRILADPAVARATTFRREAANLGQPEFSGIKPRPKMVSRMCSACRTL